MTEPRFQVAFVNKSTITLDTLLALAVEELQTRVPFGTIIPTTKLESFWSSLLFHNFTPKMLCTSMSPFCSDSFIVIYKP